MEGRRKGTQGVVRAEGWKGRHKLTMRLSFQGLQGVNKGDKYNEPARFVRRRYLQN